MDNKGSRGLKWTFSGCKRSYESSCRAIKLHITKTRLKQSLVKPSNTSVGAISSSDLCIKCMDVLVDDNRRLYLLLGTMCRALSYRVSSMWNIRNGNVDGLAKKVSTAVILYTDTSEVLKCFKRLLSGSTAVNSQNDNNCNSTTEIQQKALVHQQLSHAVRKLLPYCLLRVEYFIKATIRECTTESLAQYFKHHPNAFLVFQRQSGNLLAAMQYFAVCGALSHQNSTTQTEQAIFNMLRKYSIEPVYNAINDLHNNGTGNADVLLVRFTALAFNSTLQSILDYVLQHNEPFDESGVYQLFRIILKLQEYISEVKKDLKLDNSQRLITDVSVWSKAERVLQTLNTAIFAEPHINNASSAVQSGSGPESPSRSRSRHALTEAERAAWAKLANPYHRSNNSSGGSEASRKTNGSMSAMNPSRWLGAIQQRRKRHKGTVFIVLELDMQNL